MRKIELTQGYVALVDNRDFERVNAFKWCALKSKHNVYAIHALPWVNGKRPTYKMHRFILGITDPRIHVDHEDHNGLHNQRHNIRVATGQQNKYNQRLSRVNTSGIKGVRWDKAAWKWKATIQVDGKKKHLGYFTKKQKAKAAYDAAALKYFGKFACTNAMLRREEQ